MQTPLCLLIEFGQELHPNIVMIINNIWRYNDEKFGHFLKSKLFVSPKVKVGNIVKYKSQDEKFFPVSQCARSFTRVPMFKFFRCPNVQEVLPCPNVQVFPVSQCEKFFPVSQCEKFYQPPNVQFPADIYWPESGQHLRFNPGIWTFHLDLQIQFLNDDSLF